VDSLGFFIYEIMWSTSRDSFTFFFSNLDAFYLIFLFNFPVVQTIKKIVVKKKSKKKKSKKFTWNEGDLGLIPGSGRSLEEGNGCPLLYSCLENSMNRGTWWATVHWVPKSQRRLWLKHTHTHMYIISLARPSNTMWNRSSKRRHPCLVPTVRG